jgi:hypothetical protein
MQIEEGARPSQVPSLDAEALAARLIYEHEAIKPRYPYLVIQAGEHSYYKVLLRDRFLFVSHGSGVLDRGQGEWDVPFVGVGRTPVGDFVYGSSDEAKSVFARFRSAPADALWTILVGRKP